MPFLARWALIYTLVAVGSAFLHQIGHGVGARVDGVHLSTGVASAGDPGKRPSDPDYRALTPMTGRISTTGLLGPFTNWVLGILALVALSRAAAARKPGRKPPGDAVLAIFAAAAANAMIRIFPVLKFLGSVAIGRPWLDDEATWGLAANPDLPMPTTFPGLDGLLRNSPGTLTGHWALYFWPLVSFSICVAVLVPSYRLALKLWAAELKTRKAWLGFVFMPGLLGPVIIPGVNWLDDWVRIQW